jgi:hypothetical protein
LSKGLDQQRMIVPALDEINREWKAGNAAAFGKRRGWRLPG